MRVGIVGAGIVGIAIAHKLVNAGHEVELFDKGQTYAYPHSPQWQDAHVHFNPNMDYEPPDDLKHYTSDGIPFDLDGERFMRVGGSATVWEGISIRMTPEDFRTKTLFGYGDDWAISYDDLEPYYGQAETFMGVSGTDDDNPFAPPRSTPYPMPPFALTHDDQIMAERLASAGIALHTTPQARTRQLYGDRAACSNFGTCRYCPIGARYSPNYHLAQATATDLCTVLHDTSVRRVATESDGRMTVVYRQHDADSDQTRTYDAVIVSAGAIESARLLLLSTDDRHPDGLGNAGGQVGAGLAFHHVWKGRLRYENALYPFRFGGWSGQSLQFYNAPTRGDHAALKVEFSSRKAYEPPLNWRTANNLHEAMSPQLHWRQIILQAEAPSSADKYLTLSSEVDRFGDPYAHVHYRFTAFDAQTYLYARSVFDQFVNATRSVQSEFPPFEWWDSGSHHMGTCRMGESPDDSVVNSFGQVHGTPNLFVVGGGNFVGTSSAANPTLTILALALRSADYLLDQVL